MRLLLRRWLKTLDISISTSNLFTPLSGDEMDSNPGSVGPSPMEGLLSQEGGMLASGAETGDSS